MAKYFGTDGIRGEVGKSVIKAEFMQKLGNAVGTLINDNGYPGFVIIGQDTRSSGKFLKFALVSGLNAAGIDVIDLGVVPTPIVAFMTVKYKAAAGFVITASHNKFTDNGVKLFSSSGFKLDDALEEEVEAKIDSDFIYQTECKFGNYKVAENFIDEYIDNLFDRFGSLVNYKGKVVIDCANGAASNHFEALLDRFCIDYISVASNPDGLNINVDCGATCISNIKKAVIEHNADLGISLDGDADRIIIVDENAQEIDGDGILNIIAQYSNICGGTTGIVGTQMTNMSYENHYKSNNIPFIRSKVGDRYVLEDLVKHGYKIGGESSGHVINLNFGTTGDGLSTAIQLLAIFSQSDKPVSAFKLPGELMQQTMINVPLNFKVTSDHLAKLAGDVAKAEERLGSRGRVLLRPSGTEPVLRVMVEADTKDLATKEAEYLVEKVKQKLV
ncbi:phosphoglucosamine mutase [Francisella philomiragia]|uniref:phosphoglucosamine mutase n=1 Tax=Francisella philomiragia TaxID=28110 RepID=UPI0019060D5A|nr:phosphoglucosamine mutase [Francisella philomiragia]MBK2267263.1 phosphoglucosamine mutase [Francisella philomiragia]MBK2278724.1 phosphoglucosamine mutase [Francisella philomiragia]MBK2286579.1 phosphoglucosamine mutase [Francisella philomiragia]MBK2288548.1 phosphoglucosamine mutase [Francisella philomiragia]MBK2290269.1 phosphoglucosamine mutase [Francisella philomiragia]